MWRDPSVKTLVLSCLLLPAILLAAALPLHAAQRGSKQGERWLRESRDLDTGLRIWEFQTSNKASFHLLILVGVGSRDEQTSQAGISHYLEHCLFLSSQKRSEKELIQGLRRHGGKSNGETTQDLTAYWVSVSGKDWQYAVDWLCEQLAQARFDPKEVAREQRIVIEEIQTRHAHGRPPTFEALLYGDHPLGRSVGGTASSVGSMDIRALRSWHEQHYRLDNMVVAFAGGGATKNCRQRIRKQLAPLASGHAPRPTQELHPRFGASLLSSGPLRSGNRSGFLVKGYLIEPSGPMDLATLLIDEALLDDLLYDEIRSRRGLAYAPRAELQIHDAIWRLDCRIKVGERDKMPAVLAGTRLTFSSLQSSRSEDFSRAKNSVLEALDLSSMGDLRYASMLSWALLREGPVADLQAAVAQLDLQTFHRKSAELLRPERSFLISNSRNIISSASWIPWLLLLVLAASAGLVWWLPRRVQRVPAKPPPQPRPRAPAIPKPSAADVDAVEREFAEWLRKQDESGKG